jgi:hypothetical protein
MRPASWLWEHFHKGKKANSTQHKAYCIYHTNYRLKILEDQEEAAVTAGIVDSARSKSILLIEGLAHFKFTNTVTGLTA